MNFYEISDLDLDEVTTEVLIPFANNDVAFIIANNGEIEDINHDVIFSEEPEEGRQYVTIEYHSKEEYFIQVQFEQPLNQSNYLPSEASEYTFTMVEENSEKTLLDGVEDFDPQAVFKQLLLENL